VHNVASSPRYSQKFDGRFNVITLLVKQMPGIRVFKVTLAPFCRPLAVHA
jgi:hypothetical protein